MTSKPNTLSDSASVTFKREFAPIKRIRKRLGTESDPLNEALEERGALSVNSDTTS